MEPGLGCSDGDVEDLRCLGELEIEVVVHDHDGALIDGQARDGLFKLVPVTHPFRRVDVAGGRWVGCFPHLDRDAAALLDVRLDSGESGR